MKILPGLLAAALFSAPFAAQAQPAPAAPLPYAPWDEQSPIASPPPEADRGPEPLARAPEFARRTVELGSDFGVALPSCAGRIDAGTPCGALASGWLAGLTAFYRSSPYFAFGGGL